MRTASVISSDSRRTFFRSLGAVMSAALLAACAGSPSKESTGEAIDDSVITSKVKTALLAERSINSLDVSVETFKGRVLLAGFVRSDEQRQVAGEVARSVNGVKQVDNKLEVR